MSNKILVLSLWTLCSLVFSLGTGLPSAQAEESCDCPKLGCDPCSIERGLTFYTSKCGPQDSRLKSCGRPTCIPVEAATKECPVPPGADKGPREPIVLKNADGAKADPNADIHVVGRVKVLKGSVSIVQTDGKKTVVSTESGVNETDTLESATDGAALVKFEGGNQLHVHPGTVVQIKEYKNSGDPESRKALLQLIKGKIRNQVEQKYNGKTSSYRVYTPAAVAGVRGTDFVIEHQDDKNLETRVESLGGRVVLATLDEKEARDLVRGEGATFTADLPDASFKGKDFSEFVRKGRLSPVYKIPPERLAEIDWESRVDVAKGSGRRKTKPIKDTEICDKPKGLFNQCAWHCVGNPTSEKKECRTDKPGVTCVRSRCNGNGQWSDETKLTPAEASGRCPATGFTVKDCDY